MPRFVPVDRETQYLFPPSVQEWLPDDHLARFIVDVIEQLDLSELEQSYAGRGSDAYHPALLAALLLYGYATGIFSSRALQRASYDSIAVRYITANTHPDPDTINAFRQRFLKPIAAIFVQVLCYAQEMGLLKLGTVSLDGSKVHANASRHKAMSYGYAKKRQAKLKAEVTALLKRGEAAHARDLPEGLNIPDELARREQRLAAIAAAKQKIEARVKAEAEAAYAAKLAAREQRAKKSGKPPRGRPPAPPTGTPSDKDQVNFTDEDSRIMPVPGGGFDQAYNAQAAVDTRSWWVVAPALTQASNDKQQVAPMLEPLQALPPELGRIKTLLADAGYASEDNVNACAQAKIRPLIALGRETHHPSWRERFSEPPPLTAKPTALEAMRHRLRTRRGRQLYALRKSTVEPVFGLIKRVMKFRQFALRGVSGARGEWNLLCLAWNLKRMNALATSMPERFARKSQFGPRRTLVHLRNRTAVVNLPARCKMDHRSNINQQNRTSSPTNS
jgi:transposase